MNRMVDIGEPARRTTNSDAITAYDAITAFRLNRSMIIPVVDWEIIRFSKTIESAETCDKGERIEESPVIFINVEAGNKGNKDKVIKRSADNIIWLSKKASPH